MTTATATPRIFKYDGKIIIDQGQYPGPEYSPQMILEHLKSTGVYPELGKAEIEIREKQLVAGFAVGYVYRLLIARDLDSYATYFDLLAGSARSEHITGNCS